MTEPTRRADRASLPLPGDTENAEPSLSVLVTGSSRGIGRAIALTLAREGYTPIIHCRSRRDEAEAVRDAVLEFGRASRVLQFDVRDRAAAAHTLNQDVEAHGAYYGVVLNAGLTRDGAFPALSGDDWDDVLRTNLDGFYNVLHPVIMPMIRRRAPGRVVCLTSVSGVMGNRGQVNYSASKAGLIGAAKALSLELAKRRITVNCVAPGLIDTDMIDETVPVDQILKAIPAERMGTPEEVAAAVAFFLSPAAAYITRQVLGVNGGLC
jgi:3-oxoacyl-[acyl-carrier protein] reductase